MKRLILSLIVLFFTSIAFAKDIHVRGHTRKDGTYVKPHIRSSPNRFKEDNYSTKGNINPYTGEKGSVDPYKYKTPNYSGYGKQK